MKINQYDNSRTLFYISGMFAGSWIWDETHPQIPNARHLLVDDALCNIGGNIEEISEKLIEVINELDTPVTLVGNSLGSLIALNIASKIGDKVEGVIISGSAGFGEVDLGITLDRHNPQGMADKLINLVCYDKDRVSEKALTKTAVSFDKNFRNIVRLIRESNSASAGDIMDKIKCPVHAIWGTDDIITPLDETVPVLERFGISPITISECGHSPMFERPDEFAAIINETLAA
ncbi:2-hydroxy-6-oxo-6-phenylhexa-2,4-dienoate hydrolase [BD1-7 clade bacterium]|uniref:2-hydroxy-6-oxo-6-phenylhexa-2,4-dienoate hydrolase n=1 Tax=BD1-7 clade bacterium TaxID=2029982 RepID=A0A5S9PZS9_9GAMM|nr:2-hydroxy-6-oxo-6-phenylhexa-2,4-dienoate hydrolase [BD1-7 clade bacterium]CAA0112984.1 2-hydroxy-6-oxo-6-phenylhexa-2,4-dienoate hydrolase [BD1-7 clade bacterium]